MSKRKRKPMFKERMSYARVNAPFGDIRVRITDAREPSAREVARKILQSLFELDPSWESRFVQIAKKAGFTAAVENGKVKITKGKT